MTSPAAPNNNGRVSAEINNLTSTQVSYTYDQLNRLATATSVTGGNTNWGLSFSYDVYGNRTAQAVTAGSAPAFSATFGSNNRMVGYSYDNNGNQLNRADGATLEYDWDNRMTRWTRSGQVEQYQYYPSGGRLQKAGPSLATYFYGPGGQLLSALDGSVGYTDYVYFGGRLLFTLSNGEHGYTAVTRIYTDRLGSTRATETVEWMWQTSTTRNYYPFGEEIGGPLQGDANQYKFASTYRDSATGLDYAVNRYYASGTGRFLNPDPVAGNRASPQSLNRYLYVSNDPINRSDPTGLCPPGMVEADSSEDIDKIVNAATSYLGHDIAHADGQHFDVQNGVLKAMDCSGLVSQALSGIAYSQPFTEGPTADGFSSSGTSSLFAADTSGFHRGDIIGFPGHVAMVTGVSDSGAVTFIGSQTRRGVSVVDTSTNPYWAGRLTSAKAYKPCVPAGWHQPAPGGGGAAPTAPSGGGGGGVPWSLIYTSVFLDWLYSIPIEKVESTIRYILD